MKKAYLLVFVLLLSAHLSAQILFEEGYESGNTVGQPPVGWICDDNGWKAGVTIPDDNEARGRKPHTGDWYMYATYNTDVWAYKAIDVSAGNYYRVSFWYATWRVDHFNLEVKAGASANPPAMTVNVLPQMIVDNEDYEQISAVFQAPTSGPFYVGFHSVANNAPWYLSVDDVVVEQTSQYNFNVEQLTADTSVYFGEPAYLRFRLNNTGMEADTYQFNSTGELATEFLLNGASVTEVSVPYNGFVDMEAKVTLPINLNDNQVVHATFDVISTHSAPTQSADFQITALAPWTDYPLMEGFDGTTFPPLGWQNVATNGSYVFERKTSNNWPNCLPHNGSDAMARYYSYSAPEGWSCCMISPKLQLNPTGNSVRYWIYRNYNNNINRADRINVYYSPTTNTADGMLLGTVHRNTMMEPVVGENSDWYEYSYTFDSPEGYGFVIFEAVSGYGWDLCMDDVFINSTSVDDNAPAVVSLEGTQTWADTEMDLTLRIYDESHVPAQMEATYTIDGQSAVITFNRLAKSNYDFVATLPAQPNHTAGSIVFQLEDELGNTATSEPYDLHWDWQAPVLLEGFEGEQFPPAGWSMESIDLSWFVWFRCGATYADDWFGNEYYVVPPQGLKQAALEWDSSEEWGPQDEKLITPLIPIERPSVLTFETFCQYGVSDYDDHYQVDVLDTSTGSWNTLWDAVNLPEQVNQYQEKVSIDLSAYQGQNVRLRWRGYNSNMDVLTYSWFIDNVKVVATDTINDPTRVNELILDNLVTLYPNPAKDRIHIESQLRIQSITITTATGILVEDKKVMDNTLDWPLKGYSKGVYFVILVTDEGVVTKKIVVSE